MLTLAPQLVRTATVAGDEVLCTADTDSVTPLRIWGPPALRSATVNGAATTVTRDGTGALVGQLAGPRRVDLTALRHWRQSGPDRAGLARARK